MKQSWAMLSSSLCALSLCSSLQVYADITTTTGADCGPGPKHMRVDLRYTSPKGIGYTTGYTTAEGFFSPTQLLADAWLPFLDVRGHVFDNGKLAANIGVGLRRLGTSRVNGFNLFYDYRNTNRQHYNQTSLGLESLGRIWDFRINGYLPVGKKQSGFYHTEFDKFEGNSLFIRQTRNFALAGFNAEGGFHLDHFKKAPLYFAAGPYYLTGSGSSTWGGQIRGRVDLFSRYLRLEANAGYDHFFKWTGQGIASVNIPLGRKSKIVHKGSNSCSKDTALSYRLIQPVDRNEIIPVGKQKVVSEPINPLTGQPYIFFFVSNLSHSAGTYESPYNTLADAETASGPGDIIYIFPGDGTSTGMASGITLQDNQKLWGSGVAQNLLTTAGNVSIPTQSSGTYNGIVVNPIITSSGTVITLASGNEISGLFIENLGNQTAISGTGITDAALLNCTIAGANVQGGIGLSATELAGTLTMNNCVVNQNNGIELSNTTTNLTANISNSNFSGGDGSTTNAILWALSGASNGVLAANNNIFNSNGTAIQLSPAGTSFITAAINNNTMTVAEYGVYVNGSGTASQNINIDGNSITSYYQAIWLAQTGTSNVNIANNTVLGTTYYGIEIDTISGTSTIVMTSNSISDSVSGNYTVYFNHTGGSLSATLNQNNITSLANSYPVYSSIGGSAINHTLNMNGNTLVGDSGYFADQESGDLFLTLKDNSITTSGNNNYAVYWGPTATASSTNVLMTGNQIFSEYPVYGAQAVGNLNLTMTDNILSGYTPVDLALSGTGTTTMTMSGNTCSGYYGIFVDHTAGTFNATITDNIVTAIGEPGYEYTTGGLQAINSTQVISGNTISSAPFGDTAIQLAVSTTGTTSFTITDNVLFGGGGSGTPGYAVSCVMGGGTQFLDLSNNTMTNSGGFSLSAMGGIDATWNVNGNEFIASGSTPVSAASAGTAVVCMQLNNNTAYPTAGAYSLTNGSSAAFTLNPPQGNIGQLSLTSITEATCP